MTTYTVLRTLRIAIEVEANSEQEALQKTANPCGCNHTTDFDLNEEVIERYDEVI